MWRWLNSAGEASSFNLGVGRGSLLVGLLLVGCQEPLPELSWSGDHVSFGTDSNEQICAGTLQALDDHANILFQLFDIEPHPIEFYWIQEPELYSDHCPPSYGCTTGVRVVSKSPVLFHEIVHAVVFDDIQGPTPFEEGLAVVYGNALLPLETLEPIEEVLGDFRDQDGSMGRFVHFLIEEHGLDSVLEFLAVAPARATKIVKYEAEFNAVFDESLETAIERFEQYRECDYKEVYRIMRGCQNEDVSPMIEGQWRFEVALDCSSSDVVGPHEGRVWTTRTFDLEQENLVTTSISSASTTTEARLLKCSSCSDALNRLYPVGDTTEVLPAGRYVLEVSTRVSEPSDVAIIVTPNF